MMASLENNIQKEIRRWSKEVLEIPSPHFNGVPPCPYARQAWAEDKVAILFKHEETTKVCIPVYLNSTISLN